MRNTSDNSGKAISNMSSSCVSIPASVVAKVERCQSWSVKVVVKHWEIVIDGLTIVYSLQRIGKEDMILCPNMRCDIRLCCLVVKGYSFMCVISIPHSVGIKCSAVSILFGVCMYIVIVECLLAYETFHKRRCSHVMHLKVHSSSKVVCPMKCTVLRWYCHGTCSNVCLEILITTIKPRLWILELLRREAFPRMNLVLFTRVNHIINHRSHHIVIGNPFQFSTLTSNNHLANKAVSWSIHCPSFTILQVRNPYFESKKCRVGIKETQSRYKELDNFTPSYIIYCRCRHILYKFDLGVDRLWLDITIVQALWNDFTQERHSSAKLIIIIYKNKRQHRWLKARRPRVQKSAMSLPGHSK